MNARKLKRSHDARSAKRYAFKWELRRWSRIMLRLSPGVALRPELLE